jgi:uncharacterized membrane protein
MRGRDPHNPPAIDEQVRLAVAGVAGASAGFVVSWFTAWQLTVLVAWDTVAIVLLVWLWATLGPLDSAATRARACREDSSQDDTRVLLAAAAVTSLVGVALAVLKAKQTTGEIGAMLTVFSVATVLASWALVHTLYTVRYARLYYLDDARGIDFKTHDDPDFLDFAYLAFTVGMTFQVSDTDIQARAVRRAVLKHSLLAYLFGTVIIALTINVVAGLVR